MGIKEKIKEMMEYLIFWKMLVTIEAVMILVLFVVLLMLVQSFNDTINSFQSFIDTLERIISNA